MGPCFKSLLERMQEGDILHVVDPSRITKNTDEIKKLKEKFETEKITLVIDKEEKE